MSQGGFWSHTRPRNYALLAESPMQRGEAPLKTGQLRGFVACGPVTPPLYAVLQSGILSSLTLAPGMVPSSKWQGQGRLAGLLRDLTHSVFLVREPSSWLW